MHGLRPDCRWSLKAPPSPLTDFLRYLEIALMNWRANADVLCGAACAAPPPHARNDLYTHVDRTPLPRSGRARRGRFDEPGHSRTLPACGAVFRVVRALLRHQ